MLTMAPVPASPEQRPARILNVDDNAASRYAHSRILKNAGFQVKEAVNGTEALRLVASEKPDIVVLDVKLPDLSGLEVARKIKADPASSGIPVLHVSATWTESADRARGLESGGDAYLVEPVAPEVLIASVNALLRMRRAEDALRAAARSWQSTFDAIEDGLALLDAGGSILRHNRALTALLKSEAPINGRRMEELLPPRGGQALRASLSLALSKRARAGAEVAVEGRLFQLTVDPVTQEDSGTAAAVLIVTDVTERRQAEGRMSSLTQQLQAQTAELERQLLEITRLHELNVRLSSTLDLEPTLSQVLRAVMDLEGAESGIIFLQGPPGEALHPSARIGLEDGALADLGPALQRLCLTLGTGRHRVLVEDTDQEPLYREAREAVRRAGYRAFHCIPLPARKGGVLGAIAVFFRDSHAFSDREERLVELYAFQAAEFIENARLYAQIKDDDRRKDEFLAMLAHELRNPLSPILNAVEAMRPGQFPDPERKWAGEILERQVKNMARLVDDLMDVSRISRGKIQLRREPMDMRTAAARAVETTRGLMEERRHRLEVSLPDHPVRVEGDPIRLEQVLTNLLNNAAKYTGPGGRIELSIEVVGDKAVARVADDGMGIAPEMLPRVFELFMQVERSLDRSQGGLGIGLTVARRLVEMHGGSVEARSEGAGKGSQFLVRLPLLREEASEEEPTARQAAGPRVRRRVLVVDDNQDAALMLRLTLEAWGHQVHLVHDGPAALEAASAQEPEVVLLDIGLPGMSGYEVARRLRREKRLGNALLIALTGYGQEEDRRLSRESGFDHHLVKPVSADALERLINDARA